MKSKCSICIYYTCRISLWSLPLHNQPSQKFGLFHGQLIAHGTEPLSLAASNKFRNSKQDDNILGLFLHEIIEMKFIP